MNKVRLEEIKGIRELPPQETFDFMLQKDLIPKLSKSDLEKFQTYLIISGLTDEAKEVYEYSTPKMFIAQARDYIFISGIPERTILIGNNPVQKLFDTNFKGIISYDRVNSSGTSSNYVIR